MSGGFFRLSQAGLEHLAGLLGEALAGARIERVWRPARELVILRTSARDKRRLLLDATPAHPRVSLSGEWPENPHDADQTTLRLRGLVEGARILGVAADDARALLVLLETRDGPRSLRAQLAGRYPNLCVLGRAASAADAVHWQLHPDRPPSDPAAPPLRGEPDAWHTAGGDLADLDAIWRADVVLHERTLAHARLRRAQREAVKRLERRALAHSEDLARIELAEQDRRHGELLKTALGLATRGAERVRVPDWSQGGVEVEVPLDPKLDARQNLERYFHRYRRLHGRRQEVVERLETARGDLDRAQGLLDEIASLDPTAPQAGEALARLETAVGPARGDRAGAPTPRTGSPAPALPYRRFLAADGTPILVGKGARHNDALTFQVARGRDLWLHARDYPGSHVVVVASGRAEVAPEALLDAALLAAWHSRARGEAVADVIWTEARNVKKARDAGAGRVQVAAQRHLTVRHDPARLARLYATADAE